MNATAGEPVPAFDPTVRVGDFRVKVWRPGERVHLQRRWSIGAIGCLAVVLLVPAALFIAALDTARSTAEGGHWIVVWAVVLLLPIVLAVVLAFRPHWTALDWRKREIALERGGKRVRIPFDRIQELEAHRVKVVQRRDRRLVERVLQPDFYYYEVRVHYRQSGKTRTETVVDTAMHEGAATYRAQATAFVRELADALEVKWRVTPLGAEDRDD